MKESSIDQAARQAKADLDAADAKVRNALELLRANRPEPKQKEEGK